MKKSADVNKHIPVCLSLTCGRVDAGSDVEVAQSISVGRSSVASLVVMMLALMVKEAAGQ